MRPLKFKSATFSNKKRQIELVYTNGKHASIHFGSVGIKKLIKEVKVDWETNGKSLKITFEDDSIDYLPYDQPLVIVKDPEYLLQIHIERITAKIKEAIAKKKISKRYIAERLGTSDNQVQRLLNPDILNKNLSQLYKIADLVGLEFEVLVKDVA
jgi:DNA-binding Xre family transcriptional regulator